MIDIKIQNGDVVTDGTGRFSVISGKDAMFQRAVLCMTVPKGSFVYNRELGALPGGEGNAGKRELILGEALAAYPNTAVRVTGMTDDATAVTITIDGESRETEVRHYGSI